MLALVLMLAAASPASPTPAQAMVQRIVKAYGGPQAVHRLERVRAEGRISSPLRGDGAYARVSDGPTRLRVELRYPAEHELRELWDESALRDGAPVNGPPAEAMRLHAARLALPALLMEHAAQVEDLGELTVDGAKVRALRLPFDDERMLIAFVDPRTARIVRSQGTSGPIVFESTYDDFRLVDGALVPFRETARAMGRPTGVVTLERVKLLEPKDDAQRAPLLAK